MIELIRTNDPVTLNFAADRLREEGIEPFVMDQHMSILDGSIGAIPRRLMVVEDDEGRARTVLHAAGLDDELRPRKT